MKYYVYKTTNLKNNKFYIGVHQSKDIENDRYLGSGYALKRSIKCHGRNSFKREILFEFDTATEAFEKEKEIVNEEFIKRKDTYNTAPGGHGGKITEISPFFGKHHTQETKKIMRELKLNKKHTQETKDKWSRLRKGIPKTEKFKQQLREIFTGRKYPWNQITNRNPEKIRKTAEKHRGMKRSEEACKNIAKGNKGKNVGVKNHAFKGYYLTPVGKFITALEAAKIIGIGHVAVWKRCLETNNKIIPKSSLIKDKSLKESDVGKTWKEIGYGFEPKDSKDISETTSEESL